MPDFVYIFALILLIVLCIPKYEPFESNMEPIAHLFPHIDTKTMNYLI